MWWQNATVESVVPPFHSSLQNVLYTAVPQHWHSPYNRTVHRLIMQGSS